MGLWLIWGLDMRRDVAVAGKDVNDFNAIAGITKEDDVALFDSRSNIGAQFRARCAEHAGQGARRCNGGEVWR